ncbi:MAG: c-type cytochrome [Acidobacteriota bacterium]|nr:c-type cytochrome [Acidobacteriota bacterium]
MKSIVLVLVLGIPLLGQLGRVGAPNEASPLARDSAAIAAGENTFRQLCTGCHGRRGEGGQGEGKGPNLVNSWEVRRASDKTLIHFIHDGVSGTAMPAFGLPDQKIREVAAFVRSLNAPAYSVPVTGNADAGAVLFSAKGCAGCHMIRGLGGFLGPDLSDIGAKRRLAEIREAILNPAKLSTQGYRAVMLADAGKPVRAILKQESSWSLSVLDEHGKLHLLEGPSMRTLTARDEQWMPLNYSQSLNENELQDLLAFLSKQSLVPPAQSSGESPAPPKEPN